MFKHRYMDSLTDSVLKRALQSVAAPSGNRSSNHTRLAARAGTSVKKLRNQAAKVGQPVSSVSSQSMATVQCGVPSHQRPSGNPINFYSILHQHRWLNLLNLS